MVFKYVLFCGLLFASVALAGPSASSRLAARLARRREHRKTSTPTLELHTSDDSSDVQYDDIWAGVVLSGNSDTFTSITGTFTVPTISGSNDDAAAAWVGIDGYSCGQGLLQTGVDMTVTDGGASYDAWYEWYPDWSYDFSGIDIHAGDVVTTNITAYSTTSGIAIIENHSTGQTVKKKLQSKYVLCQATAEWIVENFLDENNNPVPFGDFGRVTFSNAVAAGPGGTFSPCEAGDLELNVLDLKLSGKVVTSVDMDGCNVDIQYV